MINILDALKAKHPEATGDTIGEIIATMETGGGGDGSKNFKVIPYFATPVPSAPKGFLKSIKGINAETGVAEFEFYTFDELWQLITDPGSGVVFTCPAISNHAKTLSPLLLQKNEDERVIYANCTDLNISANGEPKTTYLGLERIAFTPSDVFLYERYNYNFPVNDDDDDVDKITVKIIPFIEVTGSGGFIKGYDSNSAFVFYTYGELLDMTNDYEALYTFDFGRRGGDKLNQTLCRIVFDENKSMFTARSIGIDRIGFIADNPANQAECHITRKEVSLSEENEFTINFSTWQFPVYSAD